MTINDDLFDAANRHQIFLIRFGGSSARDILKLLAKAEADAIKILEARVEKLGPLAREAAGRGGVTSRRLDSLIKDLRAQSNDLRIALAGALKTALQALANLEISLVDRRLNEAFGVNLGNLRPSPEQLTALVSGGQMRGRTIKQWFTKLSVERLSRLESAVRLGIVEGDTAPQIARRYRQLTGATRRAAEALVRTSVNHVGNQARELMYETNADIISMLRWTSTLDDRTSLICQTRDGRTYKIGEGPRPPAHVNCRSLMTPVTKSWKVLAGENALKPGRGASNIDRLFEKNLAAKGFNAKQIQKIKARSRSSMNGQVPDGLTYQQWLKRQSASFQDEVLGPTKGKLFRQGGVKVDKFVDIRTGRPFTLEELAKKEGLGG